MRSISVPSTWSATQPGLSRHAPQLGQHSAEVLREAGYGDAEIDAMLAAGVTRAAV